MRRLTVLPMILLAAGTVSCASPHRLFDGLSLDGWERRGEASWRVTGDTIVGYGDGDGFLVHGGRYGDFRLSAEFLVDADTNSGIFIRCRDNLNIHPDTCYELNIWDNHPQQEARTGAIVFRAMPPLAQVDTVGRWSNYEVTARGSKLVVRVNGVTTAILENADPTPGFIALQRWGEGEVRFRRLLLEPL
jgi:hypothetical protein